MTVRRYDEVGRRLIIQSIGDRHPVFDLGCGPMKVRPEWLGVDLAPHSCVDFVADFTELAMHGAQGFALSHSLEHVADTPALLARLVEMLEPDGVIAACVPHGEYAHPASLGDASGTHKTLFTPTILGIFFEHAGLVDIDCREYERPYAWRQAPGVFCSGRKP